MLPSLSKFFSQRGSSRIYLNLVSHTLLVLVSCPHPFLALHSKNVKPCFSPQCVREEPKGRAHDKGPQGPYGKDASDKLLRMNDSYFMIWSKP